MRDFSLGTLHELLASFKEARYEFLSFLDYLERIDTFPYVLILRHDVDCRPERSRKMAEVEGGFGIHGTYYFRSMGGKFPEKEIRGVADSGHEIGYHYEDLHRCRGDVSAAIASFQVNLEQLRLIAPVKTVCMHGSPMSKYDNRDMWKERNYREFGIIGEPYFDVDFSKVMYLTDTGRRWDGEKVSIRDKVRGDRSGVWVEEKSIVFKKLPRLHSTKDLINALWKNQLPDQIMLTIHPQRWTDEWGPWVWELVSQKVKNVVKYFIVKSRQ